MSSVSLPKSLRVTMNMVTTYSLKGFLAMYLGHFKNHLRHLRFMQSHVQSEPHLNRNPSFFAGEGGGITHSFSGGCITHL